MKELIKKEWDFTLFENKDKLILSVLCGGVALYYVTFELNSLEESAFNKNGKSFITQLADKVREKPSLFRERSKDLSSFK
ncbi:hypothetical protein [Euzebyella saccharophila]|uniref:Uncharacterized protein n=1 Tax=Euzebyella saccharophila TaxID=679664 RepID=A0ABV8JR66_9FLAO|nr:hypothetical protein [Euzebyella saccharophila]